jgi:hypothetical protein
MIAVRVQTVTEFHHTRNASLNAQATALAFLIEDFYPAAIYLGCIFTLHCRCSFAWQDGGDLSRRGDVCLQGVNAKQID